MAILLLDALRSLRSKLSANFAAPSANARRLWEEGVCRRFYGFAAAKAQSPAPGGAARGVGNAGLAARGGDGRPSGLGKESGRVWDLLADCARAPDASHRRFDP